MNTARAAATGLCAIAIACIAHEAIGHGLGCIASGGSVARMTTVVFRCSPPSAWADAGGPIGSAACAALAALRLRSGRGSMLATFVFAFSAFWFAGYVVYSALLDRGDLAFVAASVPPPWRLVVRGVEAAVGALLYLHTVRALRGRVPSLRMRVVAWTTATAAVALSTLLHGVDAAVLHDAVLESGVASIGLLFVRSPPHDIADGGLRTPALALLGATLLVALGMGV